MPTNAKPRARRHAGLSSQAAALAIEIESENRAMISHHIAECRDRYIAQDSKLTRVSDCVDALRAECHQSSRDLFRAVVSAAGTVILLLLGGIGTMGWFILTHLWRAV